MVLIGRDLLKEDMNVCNNTKMKCKVDDKNSFSKIMGDKNFMKTSKKAIKQQKGLNLFSDHDKDNIPNIFDNAPRKKSKQFDVRKILK